MGRSVAFAGRAKLAAADVIVKANSIRREKSFQEAYKYLFDLLGAEPANVPTAYQVIDLNWSKAGAAESFYVKETVLGMLHKQFLEGEPYTNFSQYLVILAIKHTYGPNETELNTILEALARNLPRRYFLEIRRAIFSRTPALSKRHDHELLEEIERRGLKEDLTDLSEKVFTEDFLKMIKNPASREDALFLVKKGLRSNDDDVLFLALQIINDVLFDDQRIKFLDRNTLDLLSNAHTYSETVHEKLISTQEIIEAFQSNIRDRDSEIRALFIDEHDAIITNLKKYGANSMEGEQRRSFFRQLSIPLQLYNQTLLDKSLELFEEIAAYGGDLSRAQARIATLANLAQERGLRNQQTRLNILLAPLKRTAQCAEEMRRLLN